MGESDTTSKDPQVSLLHFVDFCKEIYYPALTKQCFSPDLDYGNPLSVFVSSFLSLYNVCICRCLSVCLYTFSKNICNFIELPEHLDRASLNT